MIKNFVTRIALAVLLAGAILALLVGVMRAGRPAPAWAGHSRATLAALTLIDPASICQPGHPAAATGFLLLLTVGLLTGLSHCVGMCGPLVGSFAMRQRVARQEIGTPLALFQLGRLTVYLLLGLLMGGLGALINLGAILSGWQGALAILFGGMLMLMGLSLTGWLPWRGLLESVTLARLVAGWLQRLFSSRHALAPFALGLANGLLPCGAVYSMSLLAAVSGSLWQGGLIMLLFGLGTLPPLIAVGFSASLLSLRLRQGLFRVAAILVVLAGVQLVLRGLAADNLLPHTALGAIMLW